MSTNKKLEGAYTPDKGTRKERIVVGLSGGVDSLVAAYLLKIQKYDLAAVTIQLDWDQFQGDKAGALSCHVGDERLEFLREFCNQLKIPLHVVKASAEFQESIVEEWMAARLTGTRSNACWSCHAFRMRLLHQKMEELDAKIFATGHYAKLFHHAAHDTYYVHTSNDEENDQSALLSRLPSHVLRSLMLPLSDLAKKEVLKLAGNFGLEVKEGKIRMHQCFPTNEKTIEFLSKKVPLKMAVPGEMYNFDGTEMFGEHSGIISYAYGEEVKLEGRKDELYLGQFFMKDKRVVLREQEYFMRDKIQLTDCEISEEVSWLEPLKAVIRLPDNNYVDCWVYPKSQKSAYVEFEGEHWVNAGEILPVLKKKGKNSKVYLTGKVRFLHKKAPGDEGEREFEEKPPQVDYGNDF